MHLHHHDHHDQHDQHDHHAAAPAARVAGIIATLAGLGTAVFALWIVSRIGAPLAPIRTPDEMRTAALTLTEAPLQAAVVPPTPEWIWSAGAPTEGQRVRFERHVTLQKDATKALLRFSCDNHATVAIDGTTVGASDDWQRAVSIDVTSALTAGEHTITVDARNDGTAAGFIAELRCDDQTIVTDASWQADGATATSLGALGVAPWGLIAGFPQPDIDRAIRVPDGLVCELVATMPDGMGSIASLCADRDGSLIAGPERGKLVRVVPAAVGEDADSATFTPLDLPIGDAQGLVFSDGDDRALFVVVNGSSAQGSGVYRVTDSNGDQKLDTVTLLRAIPGQAGEHGAHGIVVGPDGLLYVMVGNHSQPPVHERSLVPERWDEDHLLPRMWDANGHAVGIMAPGGFVMRLDQNGTTCELVSIGYRNAFDLAFAPNGELFTYDSDMEWDMGAPWYRAPRVIQLVPGADFGWRNGSGKVPDWAEDTLGSVVDTGPASPTGVLHTKDLAFHAPWDDMLLAADWSYGTVHAVTTTRPADGMTLTGTVRPFIKGKPFPVTDLAAHPDGSLIVTIGGRGTRSGMYRIRSLAGVDRRVTAAVVDPVTHTAALPQVTRPLDWLQSEDRVQRGLARTALVRRALSFAPDAFQRSWEREFAAQQLAANGLRTEANRHLRASADLVARALAAPPKLRSPIADAVADVALGELESPTAVLAYLRAAELVLAREGVPVGELRAKLLARLQPLYPSGDRRVDQSLATLLVGLGSEVFTPRAVARMVTADSQEEALLLAYLMRGHTAGWTPELVDTFLTFLHVDARRFHGGHSLQRYVQIIRDEATTRLGEGWTPPAVVASALAAAPPVAASIFVKEWTLGDLLPKEGELAQRDLVRGRHVYQAARCAECHRFAGEGGSTGPDLSGAGARYSAEDLLLAILDPSRDLTDQYQDTEVWTTDGTVHMGRVVEEDAEWLTLMLPPPNEAERIDVLQKEVKLKRPHPTSRMPNALLNGFRREEALDLLAYVLGGPEAAAPVDAKAPTGATAPATNGSDDAGAASTGSTKGTDDRSARALEAELQSPGQPGFAALQRAFATANAGYALSWLAAGSATLAPTAACSVVFVQSGEGLAMVAGATGTATSPVRPGDIVVARRGEVLSLVGVSALAIDVPAPPPADVPTFVRPDFDPKITDTPGGCAEELDAYRRILLTWQGKNGPYLFHALNAHRVRIMNSFTHYHPARGGFDEFYLVQSAPAGAELIVSEQLDMIRGVAAVTKADVPGLIRRIPLTAGDLVYLPRGVVHRGVGGAVVQVITVPGFVPGAEIGVDAELAALNSTLGLNADEALPIHK